METDGVGPVVLYRVVRDGLSEELTLGQRHAGEGVRHASREEEIAYEAGAPVSAQALRWETVW